MSRRPEDHPEAGSPAESAETALEPRDSEGPPPAAEDDRREALRFTTGDSTATRFSGPNAETLPTGAQVCDIGAGGLHLAFERPEDGEFPLAVDDQMGFTLRIEGSRRQFDLLGKVRWIDPDGGDGTVGVGVQFCGMDQTTGEALRRTLVGVAFGQRGARLVQSGIARKRGRPSTSVIRKAPSRRRKLFLGEVLVREGVLD
ncbi:MAG: PilZ domain-containing protein [Planctomycetota bacterium]